METVYLETTFISYLVALPSRDLIVAAHQKITSDWWMNERNKYTCCVSQFVIDEASVGDSVEIQKRLVIIDNIHALEVTEEVEHLAKTILTSGVIPQKTPNDAAHIAVAAVHKVDFLLTWNCKHLANAHILKRIRILCEKQNYPMPYVCTPEELMENKNVG